MLPLLLGVVGNSTAYVDKNYNANAIHQPSPSTQLPLFQIGTGTHFDKAEFNTSSIDVSRDVIVNRWGYVTITDTINFESNETSFDAFTYTMTPDFYSHVNYLEATYLVDNSSTKAMKEVSGNESIQATFMLGNITSETTEGTENFNIEITVTTGASGLFTTLKEDMAQNPEIMPLRIENFNFFPWFDFPMTSFKFSMGVNAPDETRAVSNSSYLPKESQFGLTKSTSTDADAGESRLTYSDLSSLPSFNYSSLTGYTAKSDFDFIPAYEEATADALTVPARIDYTTNYAPIEYLHSDITIEMSEWGKVVQSEKISLKHMGITGQSINGDGSKVIPVFINSDKIPVLEVVDEFTNLTVTNPTPLLAKSVWTGGEGYATNLTRIAVSPRSDIGPGSVYDFTLTYELPVNNRLNEISGFLSPAWNFTTPLSSLFNWTAKNIDLTIVFPEFSSVSLPDTLWGASVSGQNMTSVSGFMGIGKPALKLHFSDVSYYDNEFETIQVSMIPILGPFWDVISYALFFAVVSLVIIVIRVASQSVGATISTTAQAESIPYELIKDFVINYEEKTALRTRLNELEKKRKNLRKVEFSKLHQTLVNKQAANDRELVKVNSELVKKGARYRDAIRAIELSEAEREQALESINDLDKRRKQSRIRPEIYNKLKDEQSRKLRRANSTIERVLVELRSILTERK